MLDWDLQEFVPDDLRIIKTGAISTKSIRLVGDIGVRSLWCHYRALAKLAAYNKIDFVLITIPSHYSAMLGRMIWRRYSIPYGIDYIDPWVHKWPGVEKILSKAWVSYQLGLILEPWSVKDCSLITGVADGYYEGVLSRNPGLVGKVKTASMPYGISIRDIELAKSKQNKAYLFSDYRDKFNIIYTGAMLPHGYGVLGKFFEAIKLLHDKNSSELSDVHIHFIGTGKKTDDPFAFNVKPIAESFNLSLYVSECPKRISYTDTLTHLIHCSAALIIGSDRPHYTPSKVFQAIVSGKPILAILHEKSTAVDIIRSCKAGSVHTFRDTGDIQILELANTLSSFLRNFRNSYLEPDSSKIEPYTARYSANCLASQLNQIAGEGVKPRGE
ncbi:hypothetical protein ACFL1S_01120 [Pseudomonadota bacterium]